MINVKNIGFIGLGNVGSKLANSVLILGYNLFIYDLDSNKCRNFKKKSAIECPSIKKLIESIGVIITFLPSPKSISQVVDKFKIQAKISNIIFNIFNNGRKKMVKDH